MTRSAVAILAALMVALGACAEADRSAPELTTVSQAITGGELDGDRHPYVGLVLFANWVGPDSIQLVWGCSAAMISPTRMLTAGHCTYNDGLVPDLAIGWLGDDLTWVLDAIMQGYLPQFDVLGAPVPHPAYDDFASFPDTHDVGLVELWYPVALDRYAVVAPAGALEDHIAALGGRAMLQAVGFGTQDVGTGPAPDVAVWVRMTATEHIATTTDARTRGYNVKVNSSRRLVPDALAELLGGSFTAAGGTCFGDSGGPQLLPGTDLVVAVTSFARTQYCTGPGYHYRVDRDEVRDFVLQ